jgi:hypothetical protein
MHDARIASVIQFLRLQMRLNSTSIINNISTNTLTQRSNIIIKVGTAALGEYILFEIYVS